MKCIECNTGEYIQDVRDMSYTYKGQKTVIPAVSGKYCSHCDSVLVDPIDAQRVSETMIEFNKQVNATLADPLYIQRVRKKLKLDQRQAGAIFGGGVTAFSRYETGKATPPVALIKLLKILDKHPDLLTEMA
ncbi:MULTISPECIES: type II TA system antitoxin MqsA family protein [Lonepinella]|uniref:Xre family transcriptional regulator n=1 Tax=Lonepinella koalarum TaxID=53417 RepID=A0A4R1KZK9_9PAST|nr:type II TA system antitoxin MqsA family protein [Lonepinella koalarum]MDH2927790.1 antitoxin [Lonepinella koalarum]TCK69983.1 Xre family transcriptional regulator [Lonepinella koalarum]TFJ90414.1 YgiT-type zinc finger protein [Lonepinella koalarum]